MARLLIVTDGLWNGGAERQLALLASSLPEPWAVSVLSMEDGPYRRALEDLGVEVSLVPRRHRFDVTAASRMWRAAAGLKPDIVHSWGWMSTLAMVPHCRSHGIPLLNGTIRLGCRPPGGDALFRLALRLSDAVVANSRAGLRAFGVPEGERGRVIYNGFDASRLNVPEDQVRVPMRDGATVVMAARMSPAKDWRLLLSAARSLARDAGGWRFLAVGDGPEREALVAEAADLLGESVVGFPRAGIEAMPVIMAADIGVLLSDPATHAEGCSNAIMEYMACGLPVVCTDSGGNPELVENDVTGILVPPQDADALVSALRGLKADPERARAMGLAGRRRIREGFTVEAMVSGYVGVYDWLIAERGGGRT